MNPTTAIIWIFLAIFVVTAIITLGSIPERGIKVHAEFRKKLFYLLIVEVIGVVMVFGRTAFQTIEVTTGDLRSALLTSQYGWDWQYAEKGWRTRARFDDAGKGQVTFAANTEVVNRNGDSPSIIQWKSTKPFDVPKDAKSVTFEATRKYTEAAAEVDPKLKGEVGKEIPTTINLRTDLGLRGSASDPNTKSWGMSFTAGFP